MNGGKTHKCSKCSHIFSSAVSLTNHVREKRCTVCPYCELSFDTPSQKENHFCKATATNITTTHRMREDTSLDGGRLSPQQQDLVENGETDYCDPNNPYNEISLSCKTAAPQYNQDFFNHWISLDIESNQTTNAALRDDRVHVEGVRRHFPAAIGM